MFSNTFAKNIMIKLYFDNMKNVIFRVLKVLIVLPVHTFENCIKTELYIILLLPHTVLGT